MREGPKREGENDNRLKSGVGSVVGCRSRFSVFSASGMAKKRETEIEKGRIDEVSGWKRRSTRGYTATERHGVER